MSGELTAAANELESFVPDDDHQLLEKFEEMTNGLTAMGEACTGATEEWVASLGVDPASVEGMAAVAEAFGEAAAKVAEAEQRFREVYKGVRDFVAEGGQMPFSGRFFSGEDAG